MLLLEIWIIEPVYVWRAIVLSPQLQTNLEGTLSLVVVVETLEHVDVKGDPRPLRERL